MRFCVTHRWVSTLPIEAIEGVGTRSAGKQQLNLRAARQWYSEAIELASNGDAGALAALGTVVLTLRCSEIVAICVGDFADVDEEWNTLCIPDSKSRKGVRAFAIPPQLRPFFIAQAAAKKPSDWLVPNSRSKDGKHGRD